MAGTKSITREKLNQHPNAVYAIYATATSDDAAKHRIQDALKFIEKQFSFEYPDDRVHELTRKLAFQATVIEYRPEDLPNLLACIDRPDRPDRDGPENPYAHAIKAVSDVVTGHLVAPSPAPLTIEGIEYITNHESDVHIVADQITLHASGGEPGLTPPIRRALRELTGEERDADALIEGIPHAGSRPPHGTTVQNGYLRAGEDYGRVCATLQSVQDGEMSKVDAANRLAVARKTIDNVLEREELYRLD